MIPKVIHYCWFGKGKKPYLIRKCIKSWKKVMPDYEIKEWNEENFDINAIPFVKQAYTEKKWAFVADVCRFYATYSEGGIYLDTDVEVFKRFDTFLNNSFFAGTEVRSAFGNVDFITVDASVFGCEKGNWYAKACYDFYKDKPFRQENGEIPGGVVQVVATWALEPFGYKRVNKNQQIKDVKIYDTNYFANITTRQKGRNIYSLHYFDGSWTDDSKRGKIYKFCRKHDLMHIYRKLEKLPKFMKEREEKNLKRIFKK